MSKGVTPDEIRLSGMSRKEIRDLRKLWRGASFFGYSGFADDTIKRRAAENLRERTEALGEFQTYQECPRCEAFDFHLMRPGIKRSRMQHTSTVVRECSACGYDWEQLALDSPTNTVRQRRGER